MKSDSYHQQIEKAFESILLHLYMSVGQIKRVKNSKHVPVSARNKIIIDFTKQILKDKRYSEIRKNLKTIVLMKDKFGSIEKHLVDVLSKYQNVRTRSDVDHLYALLEMFEKAGFESKLIEEKPDEELSDVVFMDREHIDNGFDSQNMQVAPVSLFIHTHELTKFESCLKQQSHFQFELFDQSSKHHNYHYRLHPSHVTL